MKILITGITGFVGQYLANYIFKNYPVAELHGIVFNKNNNLKKFINHVCDINDKDKVYQTIRAIKPQVIFHLAAQSYVSSSWENPELTLHTNIIGQSNLFEAVRQLRNKQFDPTILISCSSEEYGFVKKDNQTFFTESSELRPQSPYAISKIAQDFMGFQYWKSYKLKIIRIRAFNHTGPGRDFVFGLSNFARTIARIEKSEIAPQINIRDLTAIRDFTDVRDVVKAYWQATQKCKPGEVYNVCSGKGLSFTQMLNKLLSLSTIKNIKLVKDKSGSRPTDGGIIIGDNSKFCVTTGWKPEINFLDQTLLDMINYWRNK